MSDLVPTFMVETVLNNEETRVSLRLTARFINESNRTPITADHILAVLKTRGYGKYRINHEKIAAIVTSISEALKQIKNEEDLKSASTETDCVAEAINAVCEIKVSEDKLKAEIIITPAEGGKHLSLNDLELLLKDAKVSYGIDKLKVSALLSQAQKATDTEKCQAIVAEALLPVHGIDAQFIPLVATANEHVLKPRIRADGSVDMHDLGNLPTVKEGAALMRIEPPTEGEKGINICGESLAPEAGKDFEFKLSTGTKISDEDASILISTISGQPSLQERGMKVDDVVQVQAVDLHTGNLTIDANLVVKGDIAEGMKVRCEGDITVGGVIESADVWAKGNIIIGNGILGRVPNYDEKHHGYSVSVKAEGSIHARYASHAKLSAGADIIIAEQLLHCDSRAIGRVVVGNEKTVGSQIVGGITRASEGVVTDILGSQAGVFTQFKLKGASTVKYYEVSCNNSILDGKTKLLQNMRKAYSKFTATALSPTRQGQIEKIKNTIAFLVNEIIEIEERSLLLKRECEQMIQGLTIVAKKKIYPNLLVRVGLVQLKITREREAGELIYKNGEIDYKIGHTENK